MSHRHLHCATPSLWVSQGFEILRYREFAYRDGKTGLRHLPAPERPRGAFTIVLLTCGRADAHGAMPSGDTMCLRPLRRRIVNGTRIVTVCGSVVMPLPSVPMRDETPAPGQPARPPAS